MEKETREYIAFKRELNIIKDLLGHSDVKTTEIYTKTSQARRKIPSLLSNMSF